MPEIDHTEDRLRTELRTIDAGGVDVGRLVTAGRRRARRRAVRNQAALGLGVAALVGVGVGAVAVRGEHRPDAETHSPDATPDSTATADTPDGVPLGQGTTWPGGPFEPIEGMVAAPDAEPLSDAEAYEVYAAEQRLVVACMADQGFSWGAGLGRGEGNPARYLSPDAIRAGGFDYEYDWQAASESYLSDDRSVAVDPTGMTEEELLRVLVAPETAGMTEDELAALETALSGGSAEPDVTIETDDGTVSTSSAGCFGEARAQLYGSVANHLRYETLNGRFGGVSDRLRRDREYGAPLADWQACMAAAGFEIGDHDSGAIYILQEGAAALSAEGRDQSRFTAETIPAIAAADADCQESSGLYEVRSALLDGIADEIAGDLGVDYAHYVAYQRALLTRARQIP